MGALLFLVVPLLLTPAGLAAQGEGGVIDTTTPPPPPTRWDKVEDDLSIIGRDGLGYLTAPARWSPVEWGIAGGAVIGSGGLSLADSSLAAHAQQTTFSPTLATTFDVGSQYGELVYAQILTVGMYGTGVALDHDGIRVTGRMLVQTLLYSGVVTMGLRYLLGRERPSEVDDPHCFSFFQTDNEHQSFPSGHTTVAFAVSSILADRISEPVVTVALYGMATLTAISRVAKNRHWTSDVFFGAAVGVATGRYVIARQHEREGPDDSPQGLIIRPYPIGVMLTMRW